MMDFDNAIEGYRITPNNAKILVSIAHVVRDFSLAAELKLRATYIRRRKQKVLKTDGVKKSRLEINLNKEK